MHPRSDLHQLTPADAVFDVGGALAGVDHNLLQIWKVVPNAGDFLGLLLVFANDNIGATVAQDVFVHLGAVGWVQTGNLKYPVAMGVF